VRRPGAAGRPVWLIPSNPSPHFNGSYPRDSQAAGWPDACRHVSAGAMFAYWAGGGGALVAPFGSPNRITFESIRRTCCGPELIAVEANAFPNSPRWRGGTPAFVTGRSGVVIWNATRMKKWDTRQSGAKRTPGNVMIHRHKTHIDTADEFQNGTVIPVTKS
jgi:hypothetical protein